MKRFTVKSLHVGGIGNKIFKAGDIVTERNFPAGNAVKLVEAGHLEFHDEVADYVVPQKNNIKEGAVKFEAAIKQAGELATAGDFEAAKEAINEALNINPDSEVAKKFLADIDERIAEIAKLNTDGKTNEDIVDDGTIKPYEDINEDQLRAILKLRKITFSENSKKKYLYKLYTESASK